MATEKVVVEGSSGVTASQLKDLFRQIEDGSIDGSYMQSVLDHSSPVAPVARAIPAALATGKSPILVLVKTTILGVIKGKKTSDCLTGDHWGYKDPDIDTWLDEEQRDQFAGPISVYELQNPAGTTFREMAAAALSVTSETPSDQLAKLLKERGYTLTLPTVEAMVENQEGGEDVGLRTDGYAHFAFIEDAQGSVSVLRAFRYDGRWNGDVGRLGNGDRWRAEGRLLLRNSVSSTL